MGKELPWESSLLKHPSLIPFLKLEVNENIRARDAVNVDANQEPDQDQYLNRNQDWLSNYGLVFEHAKRIRDIVPNWRNLSTRDRKEFKYRLPILRQLDTYIDFKMDCNRLRTEFTMFRIRMGFVMRRMMPENNNNNCSNCCDNDDEEEGENDDNRRGHSNCHGNCDCDCDSVAQVESKNQLVSYVSRELEEMTRVYHNHVHLYDHKFLSRILRFQKSCKYSLSSMLNLFQYELDGDVPNDSISWSRLTHFHSAFKVFKNMYEQINHLLEMREANENIIWMINSLQGQLDDFIH